MHIGLPPYTKELVLSSLDFGSEADWAMKRFRVDEAWRASRGAGVKVAVLDTGCDTNHPDLAGQLIGAEDFTNSRHGAEDVQDHGTWCCGMVAAAENDRGTIGVCPDIRNEGGGLLSGKVLNDQGFGSPRQIAEGVRWAAGEGANVISMSLGAEGGGMPEVESAIREVVLQDILVVCAAGNSGRGRRSTVNSPANIDDTIAVSATGRSDVITRFSSRGPEVDVAGPGEDMLSTISGGRYGRMSGTSMACPFVAGVLALAWSAGHGDKSPEQWRQFLADHTEDVGAPGEDDEYGVGLIRPERIAAVEADDEPAFSLGPVKFFVPSREGGAVSVHI